MLIQQHFLPACTAYRKDRIFDCQCRTRIHPLCYYIEILSLSYYEAFILLI